MAEDAALTYTELNERANRLARLLVAEGHRRSGSSAWRCPARPTWSSRSSAC